MMTLIDDLMFSVRQMLQPSRTGTVVPIVVLGIALNVIALGVVDSLRITRHSGRRMAQIRNIARGEITQVRTVVVVALRQISDVRKAKCSANKSVAERQADAVKCRVEVGLGMVASVGGDGPALSVRMAFPRATDRFGTPIGCDENVA